MPFTSFSNAWNVFLLFAIPIGGGIPAGVILAEKQGFTWLFTAFLYFLSDLALACVFELVMELFIFAGKRNPRLGHMNSVLKQSVQKTIAKYGVSPGPFLLVVIAFGTDPMTGRGATRLVGHGFISGWAIAILGDLFFFSLIMVSTLMLNNVLGDGTLTSLIIMALMIGVPPLIRRIRTHRGPMKI